MNDIIQRTLNDKGYPSINFSNDYVNSHLYYIQAFASYITRNLVKRTIAAAVYFLAPRKQKHIYDSIVHRTIIKSWFCFPSHYVVWKRTNQFVFEFI